MNDHERLCKKLDQLADELQDMNPSRIPELDEDLECYWCLGRHNAGVVCPYAPYYVGNEREGDSHK